MNQKLGPSSVHWKTKRYYNDSLRLNKYYFVFIYRRKSFALRSKQPETHHYEHALYHFEEMRRDDVILTSKLDSGIDYTYESPMNILWYNDVICADR